MGNLLWKTEEGTKRLLATSFKTEEEFEKLVFNTPEILEDIFLLKRQIRGGNKSGIPDIVGIDNDGNVCVIEMKNVSGVLTAYLPHQPPAGKLLYFIKLSNRKYSVQIPEGEPVIIRFKGGVPVAILVPHIVFIFVFITLSTPYLKYLYFFSIPINFLFSSFAITDVVNVPAIASRIKSPSLELTRTNFLIHLLGFCVGCKVFNLPVFLLIILLSTRFLFLLESSRI